MSYLNLIPHAQKARLKRESTFFLIHGVVGIIVTVIAIIAMSLTVARFILIEHFETIKKDTSLVNTKHSIINKDIIRLNEKIEDAEKIQKSFHKWSDFLTNITSTVPNGIQMDFLNINLEGQNFKMNGIAQNRETLVSFKEALEANENITELESPLSNFLDKENIEFRFAGSLKKNLYKMPYENSAEK